MSSAGFPLPEWILILVFTVYRNRAVDLISGFDAGANTDRLEERRLLHPVS
jgi:hypothetical protein